MDYTIGEAARLASVSIRTLHYYDELGLVKPKRTKASGYRLYTQTELKRLQTVLFFRELDFSLDAIKAIMDNPDFSLLRALEQQKELLLQRRKRLDTLLETLEHTILEQKGEHRMTDVQRFEGLKKTMIEENERKFGEEVRKKYGAEEVEASNAKLMGLDEQSFQAMSLLAQQILDLLDRAATEGDHRSEEARKLARLHKEWLLYTWKSYSEQAHANLVRMYVQDERFDAYYHHKAAFLRDAVLSYLGMEA